MGGTALIDLMRETTGKDMSDAFVRLPRAEYQQFT